MAMPAAAFTEFEPSALQRSTQQPYWRPGDPPMKSLFISHGAPPLFEDRMWIDELFAWSTSMPKPMGIVIISAHWESAPITITAPNSRTGLTYDFAGFAPTYYSMQYATPDASALGVQVKALLSGLGDVSEQHSRGLDHGAWVPLKVMYPRADIPVVQVSLPTHNAERLMAIGNRLRPLREEGVLIIGSGFMTHGLPFLTPQMIAGEFPAWSSEFDQWAWEAVHNRDIDSLAAFTTLAPGMPYAHPTPEHFLPIFVTLGAASESASVKTIIDGAFWGLAKRSFEID